MAFFEQRPFDDIASGAKFSIMRKSDIVTLRSGIEEIASVWANGRRVYDITPGIKEDEQVSEIIDTYEGCQGPLHGFRFKDYADFKSCYLNQTPSQLDQVIGTGDGSTVAFQLIKTYGISLSPFVRQITKPVADTTEIALDGTLSSAWDIDTTTGIVTFTTAPADGVVITAGFEFDVPVRFQDDQLDTTMVTTYLGGCPQIMLIEIK